MRTVCTALVDTLFPPRDETLFVRRLTPRDVLEHYHSYTVHGVTVCTSFQSKLMRALIHEAKFGSNMCASELLGELLVQHVSRNDSLARALWVPVPLFPARLRARGYNQTTRILHTLASRVPTVRVEASLLIRTRNTRPQTELKKEERLKNVDGAFACLHPERIAWCKSDFVIFDDVTTTGATLRAARNALLPLTPRSITLLALAH